MPRRYLSLRSLSEHAASKPANRDGSGYPIAIRNLCGPYANNRFQTGCRIEYTLTTGHLDQVTNGSPIPATDSPGLGEDLVRSLFGRRPTGVGVTGVRVTAEGYDTDVRIVGVGASPNIRMECWSRPILIRISGDGHQ